MTAPQRSISSTNASFPEYLDFQKLREKCIKHCQSLASDLWTDFNLHDPGLTILEVLCYALTDLGYRTNLPFQDLIARNPNAEKCSRDKDYSNAGKSTDDNFFTVEQILTCNPVTLLDFRKLLIDVPGVRNAWIRPAEWGGPEVYLNQIAGELQYDPPLHPKSTEGQTADLQAERDGMQVKPDGMYVVYLELDDGLDEDQRQIVPQQAKQVLHRHRNLCEDFVAVSVLEDEHIAICVDIEIDASADPPNVLFAIHRELYEFLSPTLKFYSLMEMLQKGKRIEDIYAGRPITPLAGLLNLDDGKTSHGFIDVDELESIQPRTALHTSDLYRILMDVPGVLAVRDLQIVNYVNGDSRSCGEKWILNLTPNCRQLFDLLRSKITFYKQQFPLLVSEEQKTAAMERFDKTRRVGAKALLSDELLNLEVPEGQFRAELADYRSTVHEFPKEYGIGEDGILENAPEERTAQARQLKAYLIFYDQIMANYLAQLANVRRLFSMESQDRTYFTQRISGNPSVGVPLIADLIKNFNCCTQEKDYPPEPENYSDYLNFITENPAEFAARRHLFLDHLLARFAESFTDYVMLMFNINGQRNDDQQILTAKSQFLLSYPETSRNRGRAFDYSNQQSWDCDNVSGLENRVRKLLGIGMSSGVNPESSSARSTLGNAEIIAVEPKTHWSIDVEVGQNEMHTLTSRSGFDSEAEAEAAFEEFRIIASNKKNYRRLQYSWGDEIHHGFSVIDAKGIILAEADKPFSTAQERDLYYSRLLQSAQCGQVQCEYFQNVERHYYQLLGENGESLLESFQGYGSEQEASLAFEREFLPLAIDLANYRKDFQFDHGVELYNHETTQAIAWHSSRYKSLDELNEQILKIVRIAQGNAKPQFFAEGAFRFELRNTEEVLLTSTEVYPSKQRATWECEKLKRLARDRHCYRNTGRGEGRCRFGTELVDKTGTALGQDPRHYASRCQRDAAKRRIYEAVVDAETIVDTSMIGDFIGKRNRFRLVDHQSICHLESVSVYETDCKLRRDFERLLSLGNSLENFSSVDNTGAYSFEIKDKDGRSLAYHPKTYSTNYERDSALAETHFFIRTRGVFYGLCTFDRRFRVQVQDSTHAVMLEGTYQGTRKLLAREYLVSMIELAADPSLYRDTGEVANSFGFELLDCSGTLIAAHPRKYASAEERDEVRDGWIRFVRMLALKPRRITDSYYYRLADVNQRVLLRSATNFPKEEEARDEFRALVPLLLEKQNYESLYDNVACRYTFQIFIKTKEGKKVLANHPFRYSLPRLRDEQILDVVRLVQTQCLKANVDGSDKGYFIRLSSGSDALTSAERFSSESEAAIASLLLFSQLGKLPAYSIEAKGEQHQLILRSRSGKVHALSAPGLQEDLSKLRDRIIGFANGPSQLTNIPVPFAKSYRYRLLNPEDRRYLESVGVSKQDTRECSKFVERAQLGSNYRNVAADEWDEHGFELTRENGNSFARHPSYFPNAIERDAYLSSIQSIANKEGFHLVEHILLRPDQSKTRTLLPIAGGCDVDPSELTPNQADPYTFRASVIVPYWPERFRSIEFRRFFEQTIRMEAPAHVFLRICWIDVCHMRDFETKLRNWLEVLSKNQQETTEGNLAYNELINRLFDLTNVYPVARLAGNDGKEPVILGQSNLETGTN